jgi:hypothetical protein
MTVYPRLQYTCLLFFIILFSCVKDRDPASSEKPLFQYNGENQLVQKTITFLQSIERQKPFADSIFRLYGAVGWDKGLVRVSSEGIQTIFPFTSGAATANNLLVINKDSSWKIWDYDYYWKQPDVWRRNAYRSVMTMLTRMGVKVPMDVLEDSKQNALARKKAGMENDPQLYASVGPYACSSDINWSYLIAVPGIVNSDDFDYGVYRIRGNVKSKLSQYILSVGWQFINYGDTQIQLQHSDQGANFAYLFSNKLYHIIEEETYLQFSGYNSTIANFNCVFNSSCFPPVSVDDPLNPPDPGNPGGGTPGGPSPDGNVLEDVYNNLEDPCMSAILDEANGSRGFGITLGGFLLNFFGESDQFDLNISDTTPLPIEVDGQCVCYQHPFIPGRIVANVQMNLFGLRRASREYKVATMLHEILHGYLGFTGHLDELAEHEAMGTVYAEDMKTALMSMGINANTAEALAWKGLQNTQAWAKFKREHYGRAIQIEDMQAQHYLGQIGTPCH